MYQHHKKYYIEKGDFFVKCEDTIFRIHGYFLARDSPIFKKLVDSPACPNKPFRGLTEDTAFEIKCATADEFAKFCWVIYNETYSIYNATASEWLAVLRIARKYEFEEATACAIRGLLDVDMCSLELIKSFQDFDVPHRYLIPLYANLCRQDKGPTKPEIKIIGQDVAFNIFRVREHLLIHFCDSACGAVLKNVDEDDIVSAICQEFGFKKPVCKRGGTVGARPRSRVATSATSTNREAFVCYDPRGHRMSGLAGSLAALSRYSTFSGMANWGGQQQQQQQQKQRRQSMTSGVGGIHVQVETQVTNGMTMKGIAAVAGGNTTGLHGNVTCFAFAFAVGY